MSISAILGIAPLAMAIIDMLDGDDKTPSKDVEIIVNSASTILAALEAHSATKDPTPEEVEAATDRRKKAAARAREIYKTIQEKKNVS